MVQSIYHMTNNHSHLLKFAASASVVTAAFLIILKLDAWMATSSVSILSSLIDSLMDVSASLINLFAIRFALKPADNNHSFGHGKAESLAGLGQAMFIIASAVFLTTRAFDSLRNPEPIAEFGWGMSVILISMAATLLLLLIQRHAIKKTNSIALRADSLHYLTDLVTNAATLVAIALAYYGFKNADPLFALAIAAYITYGAIKIALEAINLLMDHELPTSERKAIEQIATATPGVIGIHDLRTWQTGNKKVIQMHIELDGRMSLLQAHNITNIVEKRILALEPQADIIVHQDPVNVHSHA